MIKLLTILLLLTTTAQAQNYTLTQLTAVFKKDSLAKTVLIKSLQDSLAARVQKIDTLSGLAIVNNVLTIKPFAYRIRIDSVVVALKGVQSAMIQYYALSKQFTLDQISKIPPVDLTSIMQQINDLSGRVKILQDSQSTTAGEVQDLIDKLEALTLQVQGVVERINKVKQAWTL